MNKEKPMSSQETHEAQYQVVINEEEQYSIWPLGRELPLGWKPAPKSGSKEACLAYIGEVWTDMRPASLRREFAQR
jgi:MbtH protein